MVKTTIKAAINQSNVKVLVGDFVGLLEGDSGACR
jgi:hypothetical protein